MVLLSLMVKRDPFKLLLLFYLTLLELLPLLDEHLGQIDVFILDILYNDMTGLFLELDTLETPGGQLLEQLGRRGVFLTVILLVESLGQSLLVVFQTLLPQVNLIHTSAPTPHPCFLKLFVWVIHQELQVVPLEVVRLGLEHVLDQLIVLLEFLDLVGI